MYKKIIHLMLVPVFVVATGTGLLAQEKATPIQLFGLNEVRLLESPFLNAQQIDMAYMLEMDVDRLLAPYMLEAGIDWKAERYGNWENTGLDGHIGGHYLSALAMMYASTGDSEMKHRMDYMVDQLSKAQEKNGNGYVGGIPGGMAMWEEIGRGEIDAGGFSLNQKWVPLYNIHKIYAGLRDAYQFGGNQKAKSMLIALSDWFYELTQELSDEQFQKMLISEHGGMNEVFADVAAITGERRYLELAKKMSHQVLLEPLIKGEDKLTGMHANTQIPKVIGFQRVAQEGHLSEWTEASDYFWRTVVQNRTVAIGGNSVREHFHPSDDFSSMLSSNQGPETCNTYNMLRLSEDLFMSRPEAAYVDFYERGLYNHILSSQHPTKGGFVYFTPMRPGHYRVYSQPHEGFWCCVGSGLENHAKYGQFIYAHSVDELFINLFIPSVLNWQEKGLELTQETDFPAKDQSRFTFSLKKSKKMTVKLRYPSWVSEGKLEVRLNGKTLKVEGKPSSFVEIKRKWKDGDQLSVTMPRELKWEPMPDGSDWGAFLYGPIVLAAESGQQDMPGLFADDSRMGHVASGKMVPLADVPMLIQETEQPEAMVSRKGDTSLRFDLAASTVPDTEGSFTLKPFYQIHESRYQVYWPLSAVEKVQEAKNTIRKKDELMLALERQTVDQVATGEQQPESDHFFKGQQTESGNENGYFWRSTTAWFSYELKNISREAKKLRITYPAQVSGQAFEIYINDELVKKESVKSREGASQEIDYELPEKWQEADKLVLKFNAVDGNPTEKIYYVRLLK